MEITECVRRITPIKRIKKHRIGKQILPQGLTGLVEPGIHRLIRRSFVPTCRDSNPVMEESSGPMSGAIPGRTNLCAGKVVRGD
jgi:hypothetical protein